ncbi:hypothetical protein ACN6QN_18865, partial [Acinetobacter baumannii]
CIRDRNKIVPLNISSAFAKGIKKSRADININILIMALFSSGIKKPAYAGFFMAPNSIVENGARGRTRTGTL